MLHIFNGEGYHHDTPRSIGRSSEKKIRMDYTH